jgi:tetratricopeptide (TPR) repeat protein
MQLSLGIALKKGVDAHRAGKLRIADQYYTAILKIDPNNADANHNMGVLAVDVGKRLEALQFFKTAISANPIKLQYWLSYIDALVALENFKQANKILNLAKQQFQECAELSSREKILVEERCTMLSEVSSIDPTSEQMQRIYDLHSKRKFELAQIEANALLTTFPKSSLLYNAIGVLLGDSERFIEAISAYKKATDLNPNNADAFNNMGVVLKELNLFDDARLAYERAIELNRNYAEAYNNLGVLSEEQGKVKEAVALIKKALMLSPGRPDFLNNLGLALKTMGAIEEAITYFKKAIDAKPDFVQAHLNISLLIRYDEANDQVLLIRRLLSSDALTPYQECISKFVMAKYHEDNRDYCNAFKFLRSANFLRKSLLRYSFKQDATLFTKLLKFSPKLHEVNLSIQGSPSPVVPVFVVGMPRSGTSLVEQILSSHSDVFGAGEINFVSQYGTKLANGSEVINLETVSQFRKLYLSNLMAMNLTNKRFITDKMPLNFRFIPLICAAFPEAKIINVYRDAKATCWSNYRNFFASKDIGYCYDLSDTVNYYNMYSNMMNVWSTWHADQIYNLSYEHLVERPVTEINSLLKFLNLNLEDACLVPHLNNRQVNTLSSEQVKQKIFKGSSLAWKKYGPYIEQSFANLVSYTPDMSPYK